MKKTNRYAKTLILHIRAPEIMIICDRQPHWEHPEMIDKKLGSVNSGRTCYNDIFLKASKPGNSLIALPSQGGFLGGGGGVEDTCWWSPQNKKRVKVKT